MGITGVVFDISHYMLEDGPGIRTNVFMKGCPLRCKWCSNAYGLERDIQLSYEKHRCIGCGACLKACPAHAVSWNEADHCVEQDFSRCKGCMQCVPVCPAKARKEIGRIMTPQEILHEVERNRMFYRRGDGGITMSGGEILMQAEFVRETLRLCSMEGINTAIETSAFGSWEALAGILEYTDTAFIDCKCMDDIRHRELTGVGNERILDNIRRAARLCAERQVRLVIRLPLIPTLNDDEENLRRTAEFVDGLDGKPLLNILPYHNFGEMKYEMIGKSYGTKGLEPHGKEGLARVRTTLNGTGVRYSIGGYDI